MTLNNIERFAPASRPFTVRIAPPGPDGHAFTVRAVDRSIYGFFRVIPRIPRIQNIPFWQRIRLWQVEMPTFEKILHAALSSPFNFAEPTPLFSNLGYLWLREVFGRPILNRRQSHLYPIWDSEYGRDLTVKENGGIEFARHTSPGLGSGY